MDHRFTTALVTLIGTASLSGCSARRKPLPFERAMANMAKDVIIPVEAHHANDPVPPSSEAIRAGEQIYLQDCGLCHGTDGHGFTNLGRHMFPPAMDLTSPHVQHWTDGDLFWIIQNGISLTGMPSWNSSISVTGATPPKTQYELPCITIEDRLRVPVAVVPLWHAVVTARPDCPRLTSTLY
jgi:mono/diheme cytochrome c family protein